MWLDRHERDLKPDLSEAIQARIKDSIEVGQWAQGRYPGGVMAREEYASNEESAARTRELMERGAEAIFEATFMTGDRIVRCDVLRRTPEGWAVDEVKGSTFEEGKKKVKPEHIVDVAYQVAVLRSAGVLVSEANLVLLDRTYLWEGGEHDLNRLFVRVDITDDIRKLEDEIAQDAHRLGAILAEPVAPAAPINTHCKKCDYKDHCLKELSPDDLIFMAQARRSHVDKWRAAGYQTIHDLPWSAITDARMRPTHHVVTTGTPWISVDLKAALDEIVFPAVFIDFESCSTAVPPYLGTAPYEHICFQWSAHLLSGPDAEPVHFQFLQRDASDPRPEFCRTLWEAVREARTIVTYSLAEKTLVKKMAQAGIPFAAELLERLESATVDLEKLVAENICLPGFKSRTSIKHVLPALVPGMSYEDLSIGDGSSAMTAFRRMVDSTTQEEEKQTIATDLLTYCRQDTLAMVEIHRALFSYC